jgi:hypothetical protein
MKTFSNLWQYLAEFFLEWEVFQIGPTGCGENRNKHFIFSNFVRKSCRLWDNVEKYDGAKEAADNMAHARCMLDD